MRRHDIISGLIVFILIMVMYLIGCMIRRALAGSGVSGSVIGTQSGAIGTVTDLSRIGVSNSDLTVQGGSQLNQAIIEDNCFISDMGKVLCTFDEYSHPSLRATKPADPNDTLQSAECPGYVAPGIHIIEPCDNSLYNYMEDLEWDANQRETDDYSYGRSSSEMDRVRDRFPENLYAEEMRGNDGLDAHFVYDEYVEDPYLNGHEGLILAEASSEDSVRDFYADLFGDDPGGEIYTK